MINHIYIPSSSNDADEQIRKCDGIPVGQVDGDVFVRAWCSISFLNPGLHPDDFESKDSGWSPDLLKFAAEAWRRYENGLISDKVLYPSDATRAGLLSQMKR
jgi:hypothetical protein